MVRSLVTLGGPDISQLDLGRLIRRHSYSFEDLGDLEASREKEYLGLLVLVTFQV